MGVSNCEFAALQASFSVAIKPEAGLLGGVSERFLKYWLPLLLWMSLIFSASTTAGAPNISSAFLRPILYWIDPKMSDDTFEIIHTCVRKMAHLTEYAALGFLALRAMRGDPKFAHKTLSRQVALAVVFSAIYASSDEFHQRYVPGRHPAVTDVMIDTTGATIGIGLTLAVERIRRPR
jgi:VanZ family protein